MNFNEIIKNRRATPPKFMTKEAVPKVTVQQLLENANWAPTHKNTEPWRFKIFTGEAKEKLAINIYDFLEERIKKGANINLQKVQSLKENLTRVPVVIVIVLQHDEAKRIPEWEEIAAVSMAVQNMWLTATEAGLGAFWATPEFMPLLSEILEIKPGQQALGFFYVGNIAMEYPSSGRGNIDFKVEWK
jgi:nitroreductase